MQRICGNIKDFGFDTTGQTLYFELVNRFLKPIDGYTKQSTVIQNDGSFEITLLENDDIAQTNFYKFTIESNTTFSKILFIPYSKKTLLHVNCLKQVGGCGNIITYVAGNERLYEFNEEFIKTLDDFFIDRSTYMTRSQQSIFQNFCIYADQDDETKKSDLFGSLDRALSNYK